jgi:predicted nucleotidyltransferase
MKRVGRLNITPELLARLGVTKRQLLRFIRKWKITELALFGSILRDDFGPESDVDFLMNYGNPCTRNIFDRVEMRGELSRKMRRKVDLINKNGLCTILAIC